MCIVGVSWVASGKSFPVPLRGDSKRRDGISDHKKEFSRAVLLLLFFFWFLFVRLF